VSPDPLDRRAVLACALGGALVTLAGCVGDDGGTDDQDDGGDPDGADGDDAGDGGDDAGDGADAPDGADGDDAGDGADDPDSDDAGDDDRDGADGASGDGGDDPDGVPGGDLDLREANVTDVSLSASGDEYRVSTTLIHDDEGESGYANWWQVETLDGDRLGRRDLAHPHGTRAFTRSTTVAIDADRMVVRAHDQTHGYGGQAAVVSVPDGDVELVRQGPEPESFADR